jgi:hypothetical protein
MFSGSSPSFRSFLLFKSKGRDLCLSCGFGVLNRQIVAISASLNRQSTINFPLPFDGAACLEDLVGQVFRVIGLGLLKVDYLEFFKFT